MTDYQLRSWPASCRPRIIINAIRESSVQLAGSAALTAELNKSRKYADIIAGVDFIPFAIATSGIWGVEALELVSEIGRRLTSTAREPRSTTFFANVAVMRGNAHAMRYGNPIVVMFYVRQTTWNNNNNNCKKLKKINILCKKA